MTITYDCLRCTPGISHINAPKLQIDCRGEHGSVAVPGRFLHIRDERQVHDFYFALCEIEIYGLPGTCFSTNTFVAYCSSAAKRMRWTVILKLFVKQLIVSFIITTGKFPPHLRRSIYIYSTLPTVDRRAFYVLNSSNQFSGSFFSEDFKFVF